MQIAKPEVFWLIKENRRTRVMMIFCNCEMVRKVLFSGNVKLLKAHFQSYVIGNLEATDES